MNKNEIIEVLRECWKEVLGYDEVNDNEEFIDAGGTSLLSNDLRIEISNKLSIEVGVEKIYEYPTIAEMADYIINIDNDKNGDK